MAEVWAIFATTTPVGAQVRTVPVSSGQGLNTPAVSSQSARGFIRFVLRNDGYTTTVHRHLGSYFDVDEGKDTIGEHFQGYQPLVYIKGALL